MNSNKRKVYLLIILAVILVSIVISISYGFFNIDIEDKMAGNYAVDIGDDYTLSVSGGGSADIAVSDFEMFGSSYDTEVLNETSTLKIELKNDNTEKSLTCTFDYTWRWDTTKDSYTASATNVSEYLISGPFAETQVPNYNENKVLGSGSITALAGETKAQEIDVTTKFYNLSSVDQSIHAGKTYKGGVVLDNVACANN